MNYNLMTIICATDLSESGNRALPMAAYLAARYNAKLTVAHVIDLPSVSPYGDPMLDPEEIKRKVEQSVKDLMAEATKNWPDLNWEMAIEIGFPAQEITALANRSSAGLVVAATHARTGLERLLLGSVTRKLMHTLPCPFLIVPGALPIPEGGPGLRRILIGCDFSPDSFRAVKWGLDLAQTFEAELHLVTVIEPQELKSLTRSQETVPQVIMEKMKDDLTTRLSTLIPEEAYHWTHPKLAVLAGHPHEELNKYALMNDIDLIVMGVHGRGFIASVLVGSTTDRVTRLGNCLVMAVRELPGESAS